MSDQKVIGGPDAPHRLADPITPDALRALADGITVGDLIDHNLRAAADTIEALTAERPACCHEMQTFYDARSAHAKAAAERDEAVALLWELVEACAYNGRGGNADYKAVWVKAHNFVSPRRVVAFLSRQEDEG